MVNLRVVARGERVHPELPPSRVGHADALLGRRAVYFTDTPRRVPGLRARAAGDRAAGRRARGDRGDASTTLLWPGDVATVAAGEELVIAVEAA